MPQRPVLALGLQSALVQKIVQDGELLGGLREAGMLALAVVGDQPLAQRSERPDRYCDSGYVASGAAILGEGPPQDEAIVGVYLLCEIPHRLAEDGSLVGEDEGAFDGCPPGAGADRLRAGAASQEHLQGGGEQGLPCAGLPCYDVEAGRQLQGCLFYQGHVLDGDLRQHYRNVLRTARHQLQSSVRPILTLSLESLISMCPPAGISRGSSPSKVRSASRSTSLSSAT